MAEEKSITESAEDELNALLVDEPETTAEVPAETDTTAATPDKDESASEKTEKQTTEQNPEQSATTKDEKLNESAPAVTTEAKKYAGKYEDEFELAHGVYEIAKATGHDKKEFKSLIDEAKTSGDYSKLESKYKEYQAELTKKNQESKKTETTTDKTSKETANTVKPDSPEFEAQLQQFLDANQDKVAVRATELFYQTEVAQRMADMGIELPKADATEQEVKEFWANLYATNGWLADKLTQTRDQILNSVKESIRNTGRARLEAPERNKSQIEKSKTKIEEFGKKWKIDFTPEEVQSIVDEAQKDRSIYEDKYTVKFIKDNAIFKSFMAEKASEYLEKSIEKQKAQLEADSKAKGAIEADQKIQDNKKKSLSTISTTSLNSGKPADKKTVDWSNPDEAKSASEADALKFLQEAISQE